jgi:hypothetical protein
MDMEHLWNNNLQGNAEVLGEKSAPMLTRAPQLAYGIYWPPLREAGD